MQIRQPGTEAVTHNSRPWNWTDAISCCQCLVQTLLLRKCTQDWCFQSDMHTG